MTAKGRHRFKLEMALTEKQQQRGLMFRRSLAPDAGMLFDYGSPQIITMWMRNTLIPLDMIFIGADGRIINIAERAVPGSLTAIASAGAAPRRARGQWRHRLAPRHQAGRPGTPRHLRDSGEVGAVRRGLGGGGLFRGGGALGYLRCDARRRALFGDGVEHLAAMAVYIKGDAAGDGRTQNQRPLKSDEVRERAQQ